MLSLPSYGILLLSEIDYEMLALKFKAHNIAIRAFEEGHKIMVAL